MRYNPSNQLGTRSLWIWPLLMMVILLSSPAAFAAVSFPGEFGVNGNWSSPVQSGTTVLSGGTLTITGPGGIPTGHVRSEVTSTTFNGAGNAGVSQSTWVTFHWKLEAGNSLDAAAYFVLNGTSYQLAATTYGGRTVEGNYSVVLPEGVTFGFGLDSDIFKGTAAGLTISNFEVVPEVSTIWAGLLLVIICATGFGRLAWRQRRCPVLAPPRPVFAVAHGQALSLKRLREQNAVGSCLLHGSSEMPNPTRPSVC